MNRKVLGQPRTTSRLGGDQWEPKFPEFFDTTNDKELKPLDTSRDRHVFSPKAGGGLETQDVPWDSAPAESHVQEFRLLDPRNFSEVTAATELQGNAYIDVRFRATDDKETTQYQYNLGQEYDRANRIYEQLLNAAHPGEIIQHVLIAEKVPYVRIS